MRIGWCTSTGYAATAGQAPASNYRPAAAECPMPDDRPEYAGRIDRAPDGSLVGELVDQFGMRLIITGHRDVDQGGYTLTARVEIPKDSAYRIPAIDDDPPKGTD
jgi:hypothetical protein